MVWRKEEKIKTMRTKTPWSHIIKIPRVDSSFPLGETWMKWSPVRSMAGIWVVIGIDHDTVCAGVGGTAIRHSTSCAGRRAAACGRAGRHNECCAWWQYHPRQRGPYKWSISILPRSQFYKKQGKLAFSTSCTAVRPHRRLRNDAWRRDS